MHYSLVLLWLGTVVTSFVGFHGQSAQPLHAAGISDPFIVSATIAAGACMDLALGLWMLLRPGRPAYLAALAGMALMTLVATVLNPAFWLDPLGPLLKNVPVAAMLWHLSRRSA